MKLYIAEKPSLGRAIADVLPKPHTKGDGFIRVGSGDVVSWCIGHLLEQAEPDAYDSAYKQWNIQHLPIVPDQWQLAIKSKTRKQFSTLKKLIQQADQLVNAGDPDREGQILVDEVINHCGVSQAKKQSTERCLISDLTPQAVKKSLGNLKMNTDFIPLAASALARSRADWLYGMNMTRLCTIRGQQSGFKGVLSIGRVQTPLLGLVVRRDREIEDFVSKPFYELHIILETKAKKVKPAITFSAKWQPSEACQPYRDEEGRVLSRPLVENVASRVINKSGEVKSFSSILKKQAPPLPYNLSCLQIDAAKRFGLNAKQVLDICQQLYERHQLITYPRSDCRYLPKDQFKDAAQLVSAVEHNTPVLGQVIKEINLQLQTKAWDDKKVTAHHAIIPTRKTANLKNVSANEGKVYQLIAQQYLMQFLPSFDYQQIVIECLVEGGVFICKRKEMVNLGWKIAYGDMDKKEKNKSDQNKDDDDFIDASGSNPANQKMPTLKKGDALLCIDTHIQDKQTTPPKRFNDASLLSAMTGIARYVQDPGIRKILRETDGLGTEATRAGIIELLFKRDFLVRKGKEIQASDIGRQLINSLPDCVTLPDMTAQWEAQLESISQRELPYRQFIEPMTDALQQLIGEVKGIQFQGLQGKGSFSKKRRKVRKYNKKNKVKVSS